MDNRGSTSSPGWEGEGDVALREEQQDAAGNCTKSKPIGPTVTEAADGIQRPGGQQGKHFINIKLLRWGGCQRQIYSCCCWLTQRCQNAPPGRAACGRWPGCMLSSGGMRAPLQSTPGKQYINTHKQIYWNKYIDLCCMLQRWQDDLLNQGAIFDKYVSYTTLCASWVTRLDPKFSTCFVAVPHIVILFIHVL